MNFPSFLEKYQKNHLFIIAEAGTNHQGDLVKAKAFVDLAVDSGCSAIKFQHVIADEILHPLTGLVNLPGGTISLYEKFKSLEQPKQFFAELKNIVVAKTFFFCVLPLDFKASRI